MKVSFHAAERFLQRVFKMKSYSRRDIHRARKLLEMEVHDIVVTGIKRFITFPSFDGAVGIYYDNTIVTIWPKEYLKTKRRRNR
jgi:hypothetical protein